MTRRPIVLGLIGAAVVTGVLGTFNRISNRAPNNPVTNPVAANGPGPATLQHWTEMGRHLRRGRRVAYKIDEYAAERRDGKIVTAAEYQDFLERGATLYEEGFRDTLESIRAIEQLPTQDVDQSSLKIATEAIEYLKLSGELDKVYGLDCRTAAWVYADVAAAGGMIDETTPAGRKLAAREDAIRATMAGRVENEARKEQAKRAELLANANKRRAELAARYSLDFPDINTPARAKTSR
jgi:hypothetical protein